MARAVTAIYSTYEVADLVRRELEQLGIAHRHIVVVPDAPATGGVRDDSDASLRRLHGLNLPDADARTYQQAVRSGDYVVSVEVDDDAHLSRVQEIMAHPEAYDIDDLDRRYESTEYVPPTGPVGGGLGAMDTRSADLSDDDTVQVVEERLSVGKRAVEQGSVHVRSYVREVPVEAEVDLRAERVVVERRPVDRAVAPGEIPMQDQVLEASETVEEAVVAKEARVVEEIGLRKETEVQHQTIQDTVRKTEVEIEDDRTVDPMKRDRY